MEHPTCIDLISEAIANVNTCKKACRQDTKINKQKFWRLLPETVAITSYPTNDKLHNGSWVTRI
jgi:hypothetical protein